MDLIDKVYEFIESQGYEGRIDETQRGGVIYWVVELTPKLEQKYKRKGRVIEHIPENKLEHED